MKKKSLFNFFEIVKIYNHSNELNNLHGVILGKAQNNKDQWNYTVHIFDKDEVWDLEENNLAMTGKKLNRKDIYDGTSILVKGEQQQKAILELLSS